MPQNIPRSVISSQSNVDENTAQFWLERLERYSEKQLERLQRDSNKRQEEFEKQRKEWHEERQIFGSHTGHYYRT